MKKYLVVAAAMLSIPGVASAVQIGDDAIDRLVNDIYNNFVITLPTESFASDGTIDQWNVYTNSATLEGSVGLLILNGSPSAPTVVHSILGTIPTTGGLQSFTLSAPLAVSAGDYLGIWMGNTFKVDFDYTTDPNDAVQYSSNGSYLTIPDEGVKLSTPGTDQLRDYSINVRFSPVPLPPAALLFGSAVVGLTLLGRRRKPKLAA